jgi:hypothetical protein
VYLAAGLIPPLPPPPAALVGPSLSRPGLANRLARLAAAAGLATLAGLLAAQLLLRFPAHPGPLAAG